MEHAAPAGGHLRVMARIEPPGCDPASGFHSAGVGRPVVSRQAFQHCAGFVLEGSAKMAHSYRQPDVPSVPAESESTVSGQIETPSGSPAVTWLPVADALQLGRPRTAVRASGDAALRGPDLDGYRTVLAGPAFASARPDKAAAASSGDIDKNLKDRQKKGYPKRGPGQSSGSTDAPSGAGHKRRRLAAGVLARFGHSGGLR
jgi:hypothetical protein